MNYERIERLRLEALDLKLQGPECLISEVVDELERVLKGGGTFDPIWVWTDGRTFWLADGFHRVAAAQRFGLSHLEAEITTGTYEQLVNDWNEKLQMLKSALRFDASC